MSSIRPSAAPTADGPTNADQLFSALSKDFSRIQGLQKVLKPTQMMPVMGIVTAIMSNKPAPKPQVSMLMKSIDAAQLESFKKHLDPAHYELLVAAMKDEGL